LPALAPEGVMEALEEPGFLLKIIRMSLARRASAN
jgi:hypothetical protein